VIRGVAVVFGVIAIALLVASALAIVLVGGAMITDWWSRRREVRRMIRASKTEARHD